MPSKSRNGWNSVISSPASRTIAPTSRGEPSIGEKVVLEDLDAVEPGGRDRRQLLVRSPLIETVAIEVFIGVSSATAQ